jgi:hypothetical protein
MSSLTAGGTRTPGWLPLLYITHYSFPRGIVLDPIDGDRSNFLEMMVHIYHIYISFYLTTRTNLLRPFRVTSGSRVLAAVPVSIKSGSTGFSSMYCTSYYAFSHHIYKKVPEILSYGSQTGIASNKNVVQYSRSFKRYASRQEMTRQMSNKIISLYVASNHKIHNKNFKSHSA